MKKFLKVICIMMMLSVCVGSVGTQVAYASGAAARTILKYTSTGYSDDGTIAVTAAISVQDSNSTIIGYSIVNVVAPKYKDAAVLSSTITSSGKYVQALVGYTDKGSYKKVYVYIGM